MLGAGTVLGGMLGPRLIGAFGSKRALIAGLLVQAAATLPLTLLGEGPGWIALLLPLTFVGGIANLVAIVGFIVTAASGLPDREPGVTIAVMPAPAASVAGSSPARRGPRARRSRA